MPDTRDNGLIVEDPINGEIRARLARTRTTQRAFAAALSERTGGTFAQASLNERLSGRRAWRIGELRAVADVFGMPLSELIAETEREQRRSA